MTTPEMTMMAMLTRATSTMNVKTQIRIWVATWELMLQDDYMEVNYDRLGYNICNSWIHR